MSKFKLQISMSLDGYVAGPNQGEEHPLGEGGMRLHEWAARAGGLARAARTRGRGGQRFQRRHGRDAGERRRLRHGAQHVRPRPRPWEEHPWDGWWGEDPPYHAPVFVLTHHEREPLEMQGGTTFHFVTDGIESALERAKEAAGGKDVALGGGASVAQQYLAAGLLDELTLNVVPVLLGGGARLLDGLGDANIPSRVHPRRRGPRRHAPHVSRRRERFDEGDRSVTKCRRRFISIFRRDELACAECEAFESRAAGCAFACSGGLRMAALSMWWMVGWAVGGGRRPARRVLLLTITALGAEDRRDGAATS